MISTYVCHPSLANDNLSGIVGADAARQQLARQPRRHTLRFLFAPGTIGPLSWLDAQPRDASTRSVTASRSPVSATTDRSRTSEAGAATPRSTVRPRSRCATRETRFGWSILSPGVATSGSSVPRGSTFGRRARTHRTRRPRGQPHLGGRARAGPARVSGRVDRCLSGDHRRARNQLRLCQSEPARRAPTRSAGPLSRVRRCCRPPPGRSGASVGPQLERRLPNTVGHRGALRAPL